MKRIYLLIFLSNLGLYINAQQNLDVEFRPYLGNIAGTNNTQTYHT